MQIVISPAKSLDFETSFECTQESAIRFNQEPKQIVKELTKLKPDEIASMMKISDSLAELNFTRFHEWQFPFKAEKTRQAIFAFKGDVYQGIDTYSLNTEEIETAQSQLRILSGLYGLLRPLDMIMAYRLEMGTKIGVKDHENLYQFWDTKITDLLNKDIQENNHSALVNLASNEYFKAIKKNKIKVPIITPVFKELKNGNYKIISFFAKKARGQMSRFIIQNKLSNSEDLKAFNIDGYYYNNILSTEFSPVFTRDRE